MTTFKGMIFPHHRKENGTIPAKIRITHNRKTKYIQTPIVFYPDQYTRAFKMKNCTPKFQLDELERKYTERLSKLKNLKDTDIDSIIKVVTAEQETDSIDFLSFWESRLQYIQSVGSKRNYITALNNLRAYTPVLYVEEIDVKFLEKYSRHLIENHGERACSLYLGSLRNIFQQAKDKFNDEEIGVIRIARSPFKKFKVPKQRRSKSRALQIEAVVKISQLPDKGIRWNLARDMFMFSFYTMGMNSVDMYYCEKPRSGKLIYERAKTKDRREDNAQMVIELLPEAIIILNKYQGTEKAFHFYKRFADPEKFNTAINKGLKIILKHLRDEFDNKIANNEIPEDSEFYLDDLQFYCARHTWATFAQNQCEIDKYTIHECLNHIVAETKVTDIYIQKDWSRINNANKKVIDKFKRLSSQLE